MAIENTVPSVFDRRSSIVKRVFDCRLSGVKRKTEPTTRMMSQMKIQSYTCADQEDFVRGS